MPYWRLYYHAVWSCKNREPLITPDLESGLHEYLMKKGHAFGGIMHGVGGIEDHVHIVFSLPPKKALAEFIGKLKGASSHFVTNVMSHPDPFEWQNEYGVLTFGEKNLKSVMSYVNNQKKNHHNGTTNNSMEMWVEK